MVCYYLLQTQYIQYLICITHKKRIKIVKTWIISNSTRIRDFSLPPKVLADWVAHAVSYSVGRGCSPGGKSVPGMMLTTPLHIVESSWNVMAHGNAREGKWRGNWWMEWVANTLHTISEHGVSSINTADAHTSAASSRLNWPPPSPI